LDWQTGIAFHSQPASSFCFTLTAYPRRRPALQHIFFDVDISNLSERGSARLKPDLRLSLIGLKMECHGMV
jgi:hypothetical protein